MSLSAGCDDFIRKPFRVDLLFEKLSEMNHTLSSG